MDRQQQRRLADKTAGFDGIPAAAFAFLRDLAASNDRDWFTPRKGIYEADVVAPLRALVAELATGLAARKIPLTADPLKAVFRIHRDVRFSRDKSPYKTHAGAVLTRHGEKDPTAGVLYVHLEPSGSFAACGFYQPPPAWLAAFRQAIVARPARLSTALAPLRAAGLDLSRENALTRAPRGFEQVTDEQVGAVLRLRDIVVNRPLTQTELARPDVVETLLGVAEACRKLLELGWAVSA